MKTKYIAAVLLLICFVMIAANGYTGEVRVVEGFIENISGDSILVAGQYYSLNGIALQDPSGKEVSRSDFKIGEKAKVFFQNGRVTTILLIDENIPE